MLGHHSLKGLVLSKVAFQGPKDTVPKLVLDAINTVQMNVPYDNGNIEYDDVLQYGFGGNYLKGLDVSECPEGELRNATVSWETSTSVYREEVRPALCIREDDTGTAYRSQYRSNSQILAKQGTDLIVFATAAIGNYEYEMRYSFHDDGQIDARPRRDGRGDPVRRRLQQRLAGGHGRGRLPDEPLPLGRLARGLRPRRPVADEGRAVGHGARRASAARSRRSTTRPRPTSRRRRCSTSSNRRWFRVLAPNSLNPDGHARSYEFVYGKNDPYSSYPHLKYELGVHAVPLVRAVPDAQPDVAVAGCGDKTTLDYIDGRERHQPGGVGERGLPPRAA